MKYSNFARVVTLILLVGVLSACSVGESTGNNRDVHGEKLSDTARNAKQ